MAGSVSRAILARCSAGSAERCYCRCSRPARQDGSAICSNSGMSRRFFSWASACQSALAAVGADGAEGIGFGEPLHDRLAEAGAAGEVVDRGEWAGGAGLFDRAARAFAEAVEHAEAEAEEGGGARSEDRGAN